MKDVTFNIVCILTSLFRVPLLFVCVAAHVTARVCGYTAGVLSKIPNLYMEMTDDK